MVLCGHDRTTCKMFRFSCTKTKRTISCFAGRGFMFLAPEPSRTHANVLRPPSQARSFGSFRRPANGVHQTDTKVSLFTNKRTPDGKNKCSPLQETKHLRVKHICCTSNTSITECFKAHVIRPCVHNPCWNTQKRATHQQRDRVDAKHGAAQPPLRPSRKTSSDWCGAQQTIENYITKKSCYMENLSLPTEEVPRMSHVLLTGQHTQLGPRLNLVSRLAFCLARPRSPSAYY